MNSRFIVFMRWFSGFCALLLPIVIAVSVPPEAKVFDADSGRVAAWLASLVGIVGLFIQAGLELKGRVLGVLIDDRNKYSLSRLQMTLWSVLVLATLYVLFIVNLVRADEGAEGLNVELNWNLIVLMGINAATFVTAPIALHRKTSQFSDTAQAVNNSVRLAQDQRLDKTPTARGSILAKRTPKDARIADLIRGEEVGNANVVDIPRTQMLIITVAVVLAYGAYVWDEIAFGGATLSKLPEIHPTLLGLILVSHASYIGGKIAPAAGSSSSASAEHLARALRLSQRATDLQRAIEKKLAEQGDARSKSLEDSAILARSVSAQAAALTTLVTASDFNADELSALEGRVEALSAGLGAAAGVLPEKDVFAAPSVEKVRQVQNRLQALGHGDVESSGVPDARTEGAILTELAALGIARNDLHPRPYKFYEELAELL